jgi:cyanophycinase
MNETDRHLLQTVGGPATARVALLPTASGQESEGPTYWNDLGQKHFTALGVTDVRPTRVVDAQSARDPVQLDLLRNANFFYFSGGSPDYTVATMRGSPAWELIADAYARGAVLAGCSAGAMAFGGYTVRPRLAIMMGRVEWLDALQLVPQLVVFPHFDRLLGMVSSAAIRARLLAPPTGTVAIGVDEDTALVRLAPPDDASGGKARWRVMGRQTVTLFLAKGSPARLQAGEEVIL